MVGESAGMRILIGIRIPLAWSPYRATVMSPDPRRNASPKVGADVYAGLVLVKPMIAPVARHDAWSTAQRVDGAGCCLATSCAATLLQVTDNMDDGLEAFRLMPSPITDSFRGIDHFGDSWQR